MESVLKCVSLRKMMSALFLCMERSNWEHLSGRLRPCAFKEMILVADLFCLGGNRVIVWE